MIAGWSRTRWTLVLAVMLALGVALAFLVNFLARGEQRAKATAHDVRSLSRALRTANDRIDSLGGQPVPVPDVPAPQPGPAGIPGLTGDRGPIGLPGIIGQPGERGPRGRQGVRGRPGRQGPAGRPGKRGESVTGPPGESITGPAGPQGEPGPQGPAPACEPDCRGATGAQGPQGPAGQSAFPFRFSFESSPGQTTTCTINSPSDFTCSTEPTGGA